MLRRVVLAVPALLIAGPALAQSNKTLRVVMHSDLKIIDPIWTTAYIVRNHGYLIYDTLFAVDGKFEVQPQMVESWTVSDDKLTWTFKLRDGLKWHDGAPVTSADVTGWPSCHLRPSRSLKIQVSLSSLTVQLSTI